MKLTPSGCWPIAASDLLLYSAFIKKIVSIVMLKELAVSLQFGGKVLNIIYKLIK